MRLEARQQADQRGDDTRDNSSPTKIIIILVVVISFLVTVILVAIWYFNRRAKRLRRNHGLSKGQAFRESIMSMATPSRPSPLGDPNVRASTYSISSAHRLQSIEDRAGIDRHSSVRSVATLPAYSAAPRPDEGVLGREGERAGMDTVVEFPETSVEEEERREEEMESLYRIRRARREEQDARDDRRRRRREARERGDDAALLAIEEESRQARRLRERQGSQALIDEHESRPRNRRVSAVSYGSLGVARHDGSRVRVSGESERPLLHAVEGIVPGPPRPWLSRASTSHASLCSQRPGSDAFTMASYDTDNESLWSDDESDLDYVRAARFRGRIDFGTQVAPRARSLPRPVTTLGFPTSMARPSILLQHRRSLHSDMLGTQRAYEQEPPPYAGLISCPNDRQALATQASMSMGDVRSGTFESSTEAATTRLDGLPSGPAPAVTSNTPTSPRRPSIPNFSMRRDSWVSVPPST